MPKVVVFIPSGFQASSAVDIIVYSHGHIIPDCKMNKNKIEAEGIEYYWNTPLVKCWLEELALSGRNAVLVAADPTVVPALYTPALDGGGPNEATLTIIRHWSIITGAR